MTQNVKPTLITGATGKVGSAAVRTLRDKGLSVRALVRDAGKAGVLEDLGAEIAVGDLTSPASLDAALDGVGSVVLVSPAVPEQEINLVHRAAAAGVTHVVKATSKASADSPIARRRGQAEIESSLAASGLPHTLLRSNAYMQNTFALAPAIKAIGGFGSSAGAGRIGMVDARDVGAVAAEIAAAPVGHVNATYWLTGPELVTYVDVAKTLSELLDREITFQPNTFEQDVASMVAAGLPEPVARMNAQAFALTAEGDAEWLSPDVATLLGRAARSFREFAADFLAVFS